MKVVSASSTTFSIRNGRVELAHAKSVLSHRLLATTVTIDLQNVTLRSAIEAIAEMNGLSLLIDPRCGDELKKRVTMRTQNDITGLGVLMSLADMHDLRLTIDDRRVYLTSRDGYRAALQNELDKNQGPR